MIPILAQLNKTQRAAATHDEGPATVVAGPGTGKTLTLTARIAYLIQQKHVPANKIVALTFTKKAAQEIIERLKKNSVAAPWVGTFHQLGGRLAKQDAQPQLVIADTARLDLLKDILHAQKLYRYFALREASALVSHHKQQSWLIRQNAVAQLIDAYNAALADSHQCDYDDILVKIYAQLTENGNNSLALHPHYVLVDEFQDTNPLQYKICRTLAAHHHNLFVIGDPLQSIYSFQGSSPQIFDDFVKDYPQCVRITLDTNYRSARAIVHVATAFFPHAAIYQPVKTEEGEVVIISTLDKYAEARWIVKKIQHLVGGTDLLQAEKISADPLPDEHVLLKDIAILYRTHFAGRIIEKALAQSGIPYQKTGEESFFQTRAMQDFIATVRKAVAKDKTASLHDTYKCILSEKAISEDQQTLMAALYHFFSQKQSAAAFLTYIDTLEKQEFYDKTRNQVALSTMHGAKGLEFPYVFLFGFDKDLIPLMSRRAGYKTPLEEEKRLLYVAVTRAKKKLFVVTSVISPFAELFAKPSVSNITDSQLKKDKKRKEKQALRKAQQRLF